MANQFTEKQFQEFLKKQQEIKAAWEAADKAASNSNNSAAAEQAKINTTLGSIFNNFKNSMFGGNNSNGSNNGNGGSGGGGGNAAVLGGLGGSGPGRQNNIIQNILVDLLDVNKNILKYSHSSNDILYDILNAIGGQERQKIEQSRESNTSNTYKTVLKKESVGSSAGKTLSGAGDLLGGAGNLLGGIGGGLGKLLGGAGIAAFLLSEVDAEKIKKNVNTLLTIGEGYESKLEFLKDGGILSGMLLGIGIGLSFFAVGQFAATIAEWTTGALGQENWAGKIKENIATLLEIGNLPNSGDALWLSAALFGIGTGLAVFGGGQFAASIAEWTTGKLGQENWAGKIKENIATLLEIGNLPNSGDALWLSAALTGIGTGLAVFGVGEGIAGGAAGIIKSIELFTGEPFAQKLKNEIGTLLSIADLPHSQDAGWLGASLAQIGLGLGVFAVGQGIEAIAGGMQGVISFFTSKPFGQRIYDEVKALLSIADIPHASDNVNWFVNAAAGITAGLGVFALGKGLESVVSFLNVFSAQSYGERIYNEVKSILAIADIPHASDNVICFADAMAGIAAGLGVFAFGKGLESIVSFLNVFSEKSYGDRIYDEVSKLLSLTKIQADGKSFFLTMTDIAAGLSIFAASDFATSLLDVGTSILNFISGDTSPFEKIKELANDADKLEKGANALEKIANALSTFSNIKTGNLGEIDFEGMAKNLGQAIPLLNALAKGGIIPSEGLFSWAQSDLDFGKGILDPDLKLDDMSSAISKINYVLGRTTSVVPTQNISEITPTENEISNISEITPTENMTAPAFLKKANDLAVSSSAPAALNVITMPQMQNGGSSGAMAPTSAVSSGASPTAPLLSHIERLLYPFIGAYP